MAVGSTQTLVKMSTRNISWEYRRPVRETDDLTTFMCRMSWKSGSLNVLKSSGSHRACYGNPLPLPLLSRRFWSPVSRCVALDCLFPEVSKETSVFLQELNGSENKFLELTDFEDENTKLLSKRRETNQATHIVPQNLNQHPRENVKSRVVVICKH